MRRLLTHTLMTALLIVGLSPHSWAAESSVSQPHIKVSLVAETEVVVPGKTLAVGVHYDVDPGWHIYWKYPGTGLPTKAGLDAPDGWDLGALQWPAPKHFKTDAAKGYGYEDVLLFSTMTPPADVKEGESVTVRAAPEWLVCKDVCVRGSASLALSMTVADIDNAKGQHSTLFASARAAVPGPLPTDMSLKALWSADAVRRGDHLGLLLEVFDAKGQSLVVKNLCPAPQAGILVKEISVDPEGGYALGIFRIGEDTALPTERVEGVLELKQGDQASAYEFSLRVPMAAPGATPKQDPDPRFAKVHALSAPKAAKAVAKAAVGVPAPEAPVASAKPEKPAAAASPKAAWPSLEQLKIIKSSDYVNAEAGSAGTGDGEESLLMIILLAFLGGIILNVMPCVLPVLSIKILGLVQQSGDDRRSIMFHGLAYTAGIFVSFAILGAVIVAVQASGKAAGWGFQFQHPSFIIVLGSLIFAFGLNLFGVFEVSLPGGGGMGAKQRHGYAGSFFNGVFATVLSTPCTAPFLGTAMGFALSQPEWVLIGMLMVVAFGFAFPFLLLAFVPAWTRFLPKPGDWMVSFKQFMGFLLVGTTVWLVHVLSGQVTREALTSVLAFLTIIGMACWIYGRWASPFREPRTRIMASIVSLGLIVAFAFSFVSLEPRPREIKTADGLPIVSGEKINWRDFAARDVLERRANGHTVFIDFTADWCVNCKAIEAQVIDTKEVRDVLQGRGIIPVQGDYTNEDENITAWLQHFKRPGVPMYILLPNGEPDNAVIFSEWPSSDELIKAFEKAPESKGSPGKEPS